jgi:signal transduction histidine kinase
MQGRCREVEVTPALPAGLPPVLADERRLVQVLLNLLLNAGDAMGGRGEVRVTAAGPAGGAAGEVMVAVEDSGPGIPPEVLPRVFDPFFTTKDPGEGTGLGLAVCHGIVESFGGRIEAANAPGGGARLVLWLKAAPPAGG